MTAWGEVAVCGIGGAVAGPFLDAFARRVRRPVVPAAAGGGADAPVDVPVDVPGAGSGAGSAVDLQLAAEAPAPVAEAPIAPVVPIAPVAPAVAEPKPMSSAAKALEGGAVALFTGAACALAAVRLGAVPQLAAYCVLAGALAVVSVTDLRTGLVPRRVVYAGSLLAGVALLCASASDGTWRPMLDTLAGAAVGFFVFAAVWWISPKAMGFGDVRLAGLCGGALGWLGFDAAYIGFLASFVAGTLMGLVVLVARRRRRFPFAPSLALGTMFGVLWGPWLGAMWLHVH